MAVSLGDGWAHRILQVDCSRQQFQLGAQQAKAHLKHGIFEYKETVVTTIARTVATIPAGRHPTTELNTTTGGVSVRPNGLSIDIDANEWQRLIREDRVRD